MYMYDFYAIEYPSLCRAVKKRILYLDDDDSNPYTKEDAAVLWGIEFVYQSVIAAL